MICLQPKFWNGPVTYFQEADLFKGFYLKLFVLRTKFQEWLLWVLEHFDRNKIEKTKHVYKYWISVERRFFMIGALIISHQKNIKTKHVYKYWISVERRFFVIDALVISHQMWHDQGEWVTCRQYSILIFQHKSLAHLKCYILI